MARWTWAIGDDPTQGDTELTAAKNRALNWQLDGPATAKFAISGRSPIAAEIVPYATDLWVWRDDQLRFRGRIVDPSDSITANAHVVTFQAIDYRGLLAHRIAGQDVGPWNQIDQYQIAWDLIAATQARTGGNLNITNGIGSAGSGILRDETDLAPGKPIAEAIAEMGRRQNGFDWEIDPTLAFNRWATRGEARSTVLEYGGAVDAVDTSQPAIDVATVYLAAGNPQLTTPVTVESAGIATDPRGRWERSYAQQSIETQTTLADRAAWLLDQAERVRPDYAVRLKAGRWNPDTLWLGDTTKLVVRSGRIDVEEPAARVHQIDLNLDNNGVESVKIDLITP